MSMVVKYYLEQKIEKQRTSTFIHSESGTSPKMKDPGKSWNMRSYWEVGKLHRDIDTGSWNWLWEKKFSFWEMCMRDDALDWMYNDKENKSITHNWFITIIIISQWSIIIKKLSYLFICLLMSYLFSEIY